MSKKVKNLIIFIVMIATFTLARFALAQVDLGFGYASNLGLGNADPRVVAVNIIRIALTFIGIIAIGVIIYGGFLWMTSGGSPERIDKAKKILIGAIIGLIIILSAWAIVTFVLNQMTLITGESCTFGDTRTCAGCNGTGTQNCLVTNTWGPCTTDCGGGDCCCSNICSAICPCPITPLVFVINVFSPTDGAIDVIRNKVVRVTFSNNIDDTTVNGNFRLIKTAGTGTLGDSADCSGDPFNCASDNCDISGTGNCIGNEVAYSERTVSGKKISFTPLNDCPAPNSAWKCFDANASYRIEADDGASGILRLGDGGILTCSGPFLCIASFDTGVIIDTQNPSNLNLNISGNLCVDTINTLTAGAQDDSGIDIFSFSDNIIGLFDTVTPACDGLPPDVTCSGSAIWNPTAPTYTAGTVYALTLEAIDLDSNTASINSNITLRPDHCCNDILDGDETGVDCGGECASCIGAACGSSMSDDCDDLALDCSANNGFCASGFCDCVDPGIDGCQDAGYDTGITDCCLCQDQPIIDWVTPIGGFCSGAPNTPCTVATEVADCGGPGTCDIDTPNGAEGNFVTVGGRNFGVYAPGVSDIIFCGDDTNADGEKCGDADDQAGLLPSTVNTNCADTWTDNQVIVVVPSGAIEGPIRIVEGINSYTDETDNTYGNYINDFVVNAIERPGLCQLTPDNGIMDDTITYDGIRLLNNTAYFGNPTNKVNAINSNFTNDSQGTAQIPNIQEGLTSSFVISPLNVNSNFLQFTKNSEPVSGPKIISFEPTQGKEGQYVTIYGTGFGSIKGVGQVYFGDEVTGTVVNYDFPKICADSVWSDNQVIVKVPSIADSNYKITMELAGAGIINTDSLSPSQFTVNSALSLLPSLCKLLPVMGPNNSPISLWGEYFGNQATGLVRFHLNQDQSGAAITFWGADGDAEKIETTVHQNAATGPVRVVQAGNEGNGINFTIGLCTEAGDPDAACGSDVCCPVGTSEEGRCRATIDDCYISVEASVYEWDFSTMTGIFCDSNPATGICDPDHDLCKASGFDFCDWSAGCICAIGVPCDSDEFTPGCQADNLFCQGLGWDLCDPFIGCFCNNSPPSESCMGLAAGECADNLCPNSPGNCSFYAGGGAEELGNCDDTECQARFGIGYTYNNNLNRCDNSVVCDPAKIVQDGLGNNTTAYCAEYGDPPQGRWQIDTNISCPIGWSNIGFNKCIEDGTTCDYCDSTLSCLDDGGSGICAIDQAICLAGATCNVGLCEVTDSAGCECCCRIGFEAQDCCVPLDCTGDCGNDRTEILAGNPDPDLYGYCTGCGLAGATQAERDDACNCSGSNGKYCDTSNPSYLEGICRDCTQLSTATECNLHNSSCCVDEMNGNNCRGGDGTILGGGSCAYYNCDELDSSICDMTANITGAYRDITSCSAKCSENAPPLPGLSCYNLNTDLCEIVCGGGYECLGSSGCFDNNLADPRGECSAGDTSCLCCCDPDSTYDRCGDINPVLSCTPDTDPCIGSERGLCCGCTNDNECGDISSVGCGFDGCCRSRPQVISNYPLDENDLLYSRVECSNTMIKATFNQEMRIGSFSGNVIVAADYNTEMCPEDMPFLSRVEQQKKNIFVRAFNKIKILFSKITKPLNRLAKAYTSPVPAGYNYCAVKGTVSGYNNGFGQGVLNFSPSQLLAASTPNGATIKYYVIIKGDSNLTDGDSEGVLSYYEISMDGASDETFNAQTFTNAHIWAFELDPLAGVCELDYVVLDPASYLFQAAGETQTFAAQTKTAKDQDITQTPGIYNWSWSWLSDNINIVDASAQLPPNEYLGDAIAQNKEGKTFIRATATITTDAVLDPSTVGRQIEGRASVYVLLCENPWPPVPTVGPWQPWIDNNSNCSIIDGGCVDTKYELYYCRDAGGTGTADDYPAILSGAGDQVIRGSSTEQNILKEVYYFREDIPGGATALTVVNADNGTGPRLQADWTGVAGVAGYKLYWGTSSNNYTNNIDVGFSTLANITESNGIDYGIDYYFNLTSYYATEAESDYYGEFGPIKAEDTSAPAAPTGLTSIPGDGQAELSWTASVSTDVEGYKIYYGTSPGVYGAAEDVGDVSGALVTGLTNGVTYYFAVAAYDAYNNEASVTVESLSFAQPSGLVATASSADNAVISLSWNLDPAGVSDVNIYWDLTPGEPYLNSASLGSYGTSYEASGLNPDTDYYFIVKSENSNSDNSEASNEASDKTYP